VAAIQTGLMTTDDLASSATAGLREDEAQRRL
jgi:hypothetical protein